MLQEQVLLYIRENWMMIRMAAAGIGFLLLFVVWIQVTRTRREVHKICKKIRKYFEVILAEDTQEEEIVSKETEEEAPLPPVYKTSEEQNRNQIQWAGSVVLDAAGPTYSCGFDNSTHKFKLWINRKFFN